MISVASTRRRELPILRGIGTAALGASLGGLVGGFVVVGVTLALKAGIDFASGQDLWYAVLAPVLGLALAGVVLQGYGRPATPPVDGPLAWRTFHPEAARADISG